MEKCLVVTAILVNKEQEILMEEHQVNPDFRGMLQFPGGKVENGEHLVAALQRELEEELDITVLANNLQPLSFTEYEYNNKTIIVFYYLCKNWDGKFKNQEKQVLKLVQVNYLLKARNIAFNSEIIKLLPSLLKIL